jgi:hypothetical protein
VNKELRFKDPDMGYVEHSSTATQWKDMRHLKEPDQDTHQMEVPLCREGIAIAVVCDAILEALCP